jgi:hypothetical protein
MPNGNRTYPAPWNGRLILACKKCQKRLKKDHGPKELANLKKTFKSRNKTASDPLHVLPMGCVDLCPNRGVVVCIPSQSESQLRILWSSDDLETL